MRILEGRLLLGATDLSGFIACEHLTQLSLRAARGEALPRTVTPLGELLSRLGGEHESRWVAAREEEGLRVKRFDPDATRHAKTVAELEAAAASTVVAMREGWEVIYQPFFFDGMWQGRADFLVRVDAPSVFGGHSYEVYDAKLARHVRAEAILQLCEYSLLLSTVQGTVPALMHVVLGDGSRRTYATADFSAYHRIVREQLVQALAGATTYPDSVSHCGICEYVDLCDTRRRGDDHLSLVARMRRDQIRKLNNAGVMRLADLAALPQDAAVPRLPQASLDAVREQARLQLEARTLGADRPLYELLANDEPGFGLMSLPAPSPGDVFFDMEGEGLGREQSLEYLFGAVESAGERAIYHRWLGHTIEDERRAFEGFIDWVMARLDEDGGMHIYHYADYERSALQRLMGRHGTREAEVDRLLRGGVLVDLYRVVRQSVRLSTESYGLKQVERLYMPARDGDVADAEGSVVMYAEWTRTRDPALLESIVRYNEVDCESTRGLRGWLEDRRRELERSTGTVLGRPAPREGAAPQKVAEYETRAEQLRATLVQDIPADADRRGDAEAATWLTAQLLAYHRREAKVGWWRWFRLVAATSEELQEDRDALGPLVFDSVVGQENRSEIVRYRFEPQEHAIRAGRTAFTPFTRDGERDGEAAGTVHAVDNVAGAVDLLRGPAVNRRPHPIFLIPERPIASPNQAMALLEVGEWVASHGIDAPGAHRAARDLLLRRPPRRVIPASSALRGPGETAEDAAVRVARELDGGCLAIQGPPGAGKTYTAARIALDLVRHGRRVAVTATAHKVIAKLLEAISTAGTEAGHAPRILQRCDEDELCAAAGVSRAAANGDVVDAVVSGTADVVGGTAWLMALAELSQAFDTVIIDEAGQMSLADVVAVSRCARNIVLVGDPRQLSQVVQGSHPDGAGVSALEHLLGDHITVEEGAGIFLDRTWRMAPSVCAYVSETFYEGKLAPVAASSAQAIDVDRTPTLSGLRVVPVVHEGDRTHSDAEAQRVAELIDELVGRRWRHADGTERALTLDDIVVVAPYNAHVASLTDALPPGARVGTVDRFQGQEAAVSIFSMATSSTEDLPRNLEFLYSMNRLNVAVSRARCLSVLVFSPALLHTRCHTPEQMRLVNALCRYEQTALPWIAGADVSRGEQLSLLPAPLDGACYPATV